MDRLRTVTATVPEIERQIALDENAINTLLGRNPEPGASHIRAAGAAGAGRNSGRPAIESVGASARPSRSGATSPGRERGNRRRHRRLLPAHRPDDLLRRHEYGPRQIVEERGEHLVGQRCGAGIHCGRLTGRDRQTIAGWEEAKLRYQQTALTAFREVSNALISHRRFEEER